MILILLRLLGMSFRGRIVRSLRLLRQPKYLIGSVIGVGWVLFWVVRSTGAVRFKVIGFDAAKLGLEPEAVAGLQVAAALGLALLASVTWLIPWGKLGLGLKEAELHLLLPAPVSRRQLIQYALLKNQVGITITAGILSLFTGGGSALQRLLWFAGIWVAFNAWDLNSKLRGMFLLRQRELGSGTARLRWALLFVVLLGCWALALPLVVDAGTMAWNEIRHVRTLAGVNRALTVFQQAAASGSLLGVLLKPFAWVVGPVFALGPVDFLLALVPAVGLCVLQHELIVRSPARFEEASLLHAEEETRAKAPTSALAKMSDRARLRQPFRLAAVGPPEVAILWKNTISALRWPLPRLAWVATGLLVVIALLLPLARTPAPLFGIIAILGLVGVVSFPFTAGMSWRNDFRGEFQYIELVRTWPVGAERFALAEMLSPALLSVLSSAFGAAVIMAALIGARFAESLSGERGMLLPESGTAILGLRYELAVPLILLSAAPFVVGLATISSALQNLVVLFVPAWAAHGKHSAKGIAAFGQQLLFAAALGLAFFIVMIPSTLLVLVALAAQWLLGIPWSAWLFPVWGALAGAPLFVGSYLVLRAAAALWQNLDPAQELLESAS